ncbi:hypothetical protein DFP72DRAFT_164945 [Ephemerocybe angulata]|uniref:Uncharacterized protein n=1 Tax=Ephemerocybe angulata TaxID=980116 RepID=A0A8H6I4V9_9AGAR|nr:hypothetical protein DFP72DRAFT_164945 [Tulosesus angulatus]
MPATMALKNITQTPTHSNTEVPSIRLVSATPSSTSISMSTSSPMLGTSATPWDELPPPPPIPKHHLTSSSSSSRLRPKASSTTMKDASTSAAPAARLVPKKSKLRMLGSLGRDKQDKRDFSDVVRRVAGNNPAASQSQSSLNLLQGGGFMGGSSKLSSLRGGFEIYVEPAGDPEMEDVVVVKKGRGRGGLEGVGWGPKTSTSGGRVLGDIDINTNGGVGGSGNGGKKEGGLKVKGEEGGKWWSIGRGRRDSKEDKKEKARDKENAENVRSKSTSFRPSVPLLILRADVLTYCDLCSPRPLQKDRHRTTPRALQLPGCRHPPRALQEEILLAASQLAAYIFGELFSVGVGVRRGAAGDSG